MQHRYVFVGGLHRSGTTVLARCLGAHPEISGFSGTGAHEDEGQHLQDVYPSALEFGGAGVFAFEPAARLTEESPLATPASRERLLAQWSPHWRLDRPVLVEKSPPNLIRMRFLHALFPGSLCVVIVRHPVAVAYATRKRRPNRRLPTLFRHWLAAHDLLAADRRVLGEALHVVHYEDFVRDPAAALGRIYDALGLAHHPPGEAIDAGGNDPYFAQWRRGGPVHAGGRALLGARFEARVRRYGYSLRDLDLREDTPLLD